MLCYPNGALRSYLAAAKCCLAGSGEGVTSIPDRPDPSGADLRWCHCSPTPYLEVTVGAVLSSAPGGNLDGLQRFGVVATRSFAVPVLGDGIPRHDR
jgi:hypothetical protein